MCIICLDSIVTNKYWQSIWKAQRKMSFPPHKEIAMPLNLDGFPAKQRAIAKKKKLLSLWEKNWMPFECNNLLQKQPKT